MVKSDGEITLRGMTDSLTFNTHFSFMKSCSWLHKAGMHVCMIRMYASARHDELSYFIYCTYFLAALTPQEPVKYCTHGGRMDSGRKVT
jgi:hypothetical protein